MSEKANNTPIKKVKLNYISAVSHTPPKAIIPVSSAKMEELDRAIIIFSCLSHDYFNSVLNYKKPNLSNSLFFNILYLNNMQKNFSKKS